MHKQPEKVSINKNENTVFPDIFSLNEDNSSHHLQQHNELNKKVIPNVDVHHQNNSHRPRQLSGRHH